MRRMNSMLLGHQGASGRTDCMYLRMASCVAGSSQESGRCTMREGTTMSSRSGMRRSTESQRFEQRLAGETAAVVVDVEGADAGGDVEDAGEAFGAQADSRAWTRKRRLRSRTLGPYSTSRYLSPSARARRRGPGAGGRRPRQDRLFADGRGWDLGPRASRLAMAWSSCASMAGPGLRRWRGSGRGRRGGAGRFSRARRAMMVAGQTKPPRLGPSGPRMTGMSPVKSMVPMA